MGTYTGNKEYFRIIEGSCIGVGLSTRGRADSVICMTILSEDDECYFESTNGWCAWWLPHINKFLQEVEKELNEKYPKNAHGEWYLP